MIIVDETLGGQRTRAFTLESLSEKTTVREIIRARIWQEVHDYNRQKRAATFRGLVRPTDEEARLNGLGATADTQTRAFKPIDWEKQFHIALRAFESNGFFILVGDRQATQLDDEVEVGPETEVSFVKLVPLVGG